MRIPLLFIVLLFATRLFGQLPPDTKKEAKRQMQALRITEAPKIDGSLDEDIWKQAEITSGFTQQTPNPGLPATEKTEVRILYDDAAIYIGAMMYDQPDSILKALSERDGLANTAFFGIFIDAYQDGVNGNAFVVTPAGVQFDAKESAFGEDSRWNAVWKSEAKVVENGWVVEMKIPYSALRFPKTEVQTWTINFLRRIHRKGERDWWSPLKPDVAGLFPQSGELNGIENIKSPFRLFLYPYISGAVTHVPTDNSDISGWGRDFSAGMDIKYGINDAFTLDMTLIPDFGQARSDNEVLNLSPFEVRYDENRQFFTEGTELFNKGNLFYSRRVGGRPIGYFDVEDQLDSLEYIKQNPQEAQLFNSTKISGRTNSGLGIGVFNAISARTFATVVDTASEESTERRIMTSPLTNYNVFVLDQSLKNNSYVTLINTNVWREGLKEDSLNIAYEANSTGGLFNIQDKKNNYALSGGTVLTQKYYDNFNAPDLGFAYDIDFSRISGKINYGFWHEATSNKFDPNDLGFATRNNQQTWGASFNYNIYEPKGLFLARYNGIRVNYRRQFQPNKFNKLEFNGFTNNTFKNFWVSELWFYLSPINSNDFFEARSDGRVFIRPKDLTIGNVIQTDDRKKFVGQVNWRAATYFEKGMFTWQVGSRPRYQISDKLRLEMELYYQVDVKKRGYAETIDIIGELDDVIIGTRTVKTSTNVLSASYIFNNKMGLNLRARHYWSSAKYHKYHRLLPDGNLEDLPNFDKYDDEGVPKHDVSFNAFTIDMVYTWQFLPGSELSLVWKNAIFSDEPNADKGYIYNLGQTFKSDQSNNVSLKILFFLDALYFKELSKKKNAL